MTDASRSSCSFACSAPLSTARCCSSLGDDLPDAGDRQAFLAGDFLIGEALAQPGENAPSPEHHAMRAQPPPPRGRCRFNHSTLLPPAQAALIEKIIRISHILIIIKTNAQILFLDRYEDKASGA
jgi:hypothetical protein